MSLSRVIRGSLWLYISSLVSNFLGYIYWFATARFVDPMTIGTGAAVVGASSLIAGALSLGLSSGATKMIGKSAGMGNSKNVSGYFTTALSISISIYLTASLLILLLPEGIMGFSKFETMFVVLLIMIGYGSWDSILSVLFSSTLRTEVNATASILSSFFRLGIGVLLLYLGFGFLGVMGGYITSSLVAEAVYLYRCKGAIKILRPNSTLAKEVLSASLPSYIPSILNVAGTWLGILGVYGLVGGEQTGTYYIAFMIASLVYTLPSALLGLMFPVLSGMEDHRKRTISRAVRITCAVISPISALGIVYPWVPLGLLGEAYIPSKLALQVLLLGTFVAPLSSGFYSLVYAYGRYKLVTLLGMALNVPRVLLYLPLASFWGDVGAAAVYTSGYFSALVAVIILSRRVGYRIGVKENALLVGVPLIVALVAYLLYLPWIIGTIAVVAISIFAYVRLGLITREDLRDVSEALLSKRQIEAAYPYTKYIMPILYKDSEEGK
ncbi:MAG: hypothetical protein ACUVQ5_04605 [Candidatus Methanomethylicaceae archaeon]